MALEQLGDGTGVCAGEDQGSLPAQCAGLAKTPRPSLETRPPSGCWRQLLHSRPAGLVLQRCWERSLAWRARWRSLCSHLSKSPIVGRGREAQAEGRRGRGEAGGSFSPWLALLPPAKTA